MDTYLNSTLKTLLSSELARVAINLRKSWYILTVVDSNTGSIHKRPANPGSFFMYAPDWIN